MDLDRAQRVAGKFLRAQDSDAAIDRLSDDLADRFLDALASHARFDEKDVAQLLSDQGVHADDVNALDSGKQAGPAIRALGGLIKQGLWNLLVRPFLALGKLVKSSQFRQDVKRAFRKSLSHELRAARHLGRVVERMALGEDVPPPERKAAMRQLVSLLAQTLIIYFAGPQVSGLFSVGIWQAVARLTQPVGELALILLRNPINAAVKQLLASER